MGGEPVNSWVVSKEDFIVVGEADDLLFFDHLPFYLFEVLGDLLRVILYTQCQFRIHLIDELVYTQKLIGRE